MTNLKALGLVKTKNALDQISFIQSGTGEMKNSNTFEILKKKKSYTFFLTEVHRERQGPMFPTLVEGRMTLWAGSPDEPGSTISKTATTQVAYNIAVFPPL